MEHDEDTDMGVYWDREDSQDHSQEGQKAGEDSGFSVPVKSDWWLKYEALCRGETTQVCITCHVMISFTRMFVNTCTCLTISWGVLQN